MSEVHDGFLPKWTIFCFYYSWNEINVTLQCHINHVAVASDSARSPDPNMSHQGKQVDGQQNYCERTANFHQEIAREAILRRRHCQTTNKKQEKQKNGRPRNKMSIWLSRHTYILSLHLLLFAGGRSEVLLYEQSTGGLSISPLHDGLERSSPKSWPDVKSLRHQLVVATLLLSREIRGYRKR